jgi:hypothetical protein
LKFRANPIQKLHQSYDTGTVVRLRNITGDLVVNFIFEHKKLPKNPIL